MNCFVQREPRCFHQKLLQILTCGHNFHRLWTVWDKASWAKALYRRIATLLQQYDMTAVGAMELDLDLGKGISRSPNKRADAQIVFL